MTNRYLPTALRRTLERTIKDARIIAEEGAGDAIQRLGVAAGKAPTYLNDAEKELRRRLRAHARALGDAFNKSDETQETKRLVEAAAYAHWHRMLFARFLAERGLLRNPEYDVPVSLEDCRELAGTEGLTDPWVIAERYAASMLPAVFRIDDPVLAIELDPVHTQKLHRLVTGLDVEVFQAEDSLGWTYQFWRSAEKDAVNASGVKIGADELPAVTQLFTEPYMVRFLLHNTLGAWWAGQVLATNPALAQTAANEDALRAACSLPSYSFDMLRFVREGEDSPWRPAAGTFAGWPRKAKAITFLDPCCGSGHFLTEALAILVALRLAEENLSAADAVAAVLRDNLHGLEIDGRCVQLAAFAVALTAWRLGGWQALPLPHIAWVGAPPPLPKQEFTNLADGDAELEYALAALHDLFSRAPLLGSLIEPTGGDLFESERLKEVERLLAPLLERSRKAEPEHIEGAIAARGMSDAASLLHKKYTLQATNVPYLGKTKQKPQLSSYISGRFPEGKSDLATAMLQRMFLLAQEGGTASTVSPQNWLFLGSYEKLRREIFHKMEISIVCDLGPAAFNEMNWWVARTALFAATMTKADTSHRYLALNADTGRDLVAKPALMKTRKPLLLPQMKQAKGPDARITVNPPFTGELLSKYASSFQGVSPADAPRFSRFFWELFADFGDFHFWQSTIDQTIEFGGRELVINMGRALDEAVDDGQAFIRGTDAWGKAGVVVRQMRHLPVTLYSGHVFDTNAAVIVAHREENTAAIWEYCRSPEFHDNVRRIDQKVNVTNATLVKVPFDLERWTQLAKSKYPRGLPEPNSIDPTQWPFHGHPAETRGGTDLHVALARLSGYRWPAETDSKMRLSDEARAMVARASSLPSGDDDGLLGVPPVAGEKPLADRLRSHLAAAFGDDWSDALERRLVAEADELLDKKVARDGSLEAWVRDRAFRQHCALFGQRPFLWHISDGLKDGFSVFVHYHRFNQANLRKLTFTLLGDWLARAKAENNTLRYEKGRELQQKLEKILEGEKPYDIFVRWKSLAQQPLGWNPDLDDGVRQNIRPFIKGGVLTHDLSKILKDKDRGKDVPSAPWYDVFIGERRNDHHTTLAEKRAAREAAAKRVEAAK
ncbi:Eco57I restriction-modification methylase domain-containing protein [Nitratireductor sp. GCM10026969]|uniref:Eco57I restriction-modification methylase domain-containing protein n=1 Tax=Nitratireductor sp. GCM10026969 TaxID=3252645 RepID=UPI0036072B91